MKAKHAFWQGANGRQITKRIIIECDLVLKTPAHFGNGDRDEMTDMPLLVDAKDGKTPLLTGTSIAGALRSYLYSYEHGFPDGEIKKWGLTSQLFGGLREDDEGKQSPLIVEDAYAEDGTFDIELRHSNRINPDSRTADDKALFSYQLWTAGTTFRLRFELLISQNDNEKDLLTALNVALQGLQDGGITLGMRKQRGFGTVTVKNWQIRAYDFRQLADFLAWVEDSPPPSTGLQRDLSQVLTGSSIRDKRHLFTLNAIFFIKDSLIVRSDGGYRTIEPDMVHLRSYRPDEEKDLPILPGTSLAGVLRHRATKICCTLGKGEQSISFVEQIFGPRMSKEELGKKKVEPFASRLHISEATITDVVPKGYVQNRVSIDRFTGGARDTALFSQQPIFSRPKQTAVSLTWQLKQPTDAEIGLLLLLLKDLWTGDLPVGGEASVGRGRLTGHEATLTLQRGQGNAYEWKIMDQGTVTEGDTVSLQKFVDALRQVHDVKN